LATESFLSISEASRVVGLSVFCLRSLARRGLLPEFRDGRGWRRFRHRDLTRLAEARRPRPVRGCAAQ